MCTQSAQEPLLILSCKQKSHVACLLPQQPTRLTAAPKAESHIWVGKHHPSRASLAAPQYDALVIGVGWQRSHPD